MNGNEYRRASFRKLPTHEAGCRMPSARTIEAGDRARRLDAEQGSRMLAERVNKYLRRLHGGGE